MSKSEINVTIEGITYHAKVELNKDNDEEIKKTLIKIINEYKNKNKNKIMKIKLKKIK